MLESCKDFIFQGITCSSQAQERFWDILKGSTLNMKSAPKSLTMSPLVQKVRKVRKSSIQSNHDTQAWRSGWLFKEKTLVWFYDCKGTGCGDQQNICVSAFLQTVNPLDYKGETQTEYLPQAYCCPVGMVFSYKEGGKHAFKRNHVITIYWLWLGN